MRRFTHRAGQTPPRLASSAPHYIDPSLFDISPPAGPRPLPRGPLLAAAALCLTVLLAVALISAARSTSSKNPPVETTTVEETATDAHPFESATMADPADTSCESTNDPATVEGETDRTTEPTTRPVETTSAVTDPPAPPSGAYLITPDDMSEIARGPAALTGQSAALPPTLPTVTFAADPVVLVVHSAPTQGYSDGTPWYDPATGPLGVVAPDAPDGITALGAALTEELEFLGIRAIHLTVPAADGGTEGAYTAVDTLVREYCRLYPRIALVLDLRRTAEMTAAGDVLRTEGQYEGDMTAQLRISVSRDRASAALSRDLTLALTLRQTLWQMEPTLSRPVHLRSGAGLGGSDPAMDTVPVLTLDLGSAGNTVDEARRLLAPLSRALASLLSPA